MLRRISEIDGITIFVKKKKILRLSNSFSEVPLRKKSKFERNPGVEFNRKGKVEGKKPNEREREKRQKGME